MINQLKRFKLSFEELGSYMKKGGLLPYFLYSFSTLIITLLFVFFFLFSIGSAIYEVSQLELSEIDQFMKQLFIEIFLHKMIFPYIVLLGFFFGKIFFLAGYLGYYKHLFLEDKKTSFFLNGVRYFFRVLIASGIAAIINGVLIVIIPYILSFLIPILSTLVATVIGSVIAIPAGIISFIVGVFITLITFALTTGITYLSVLKGNPFTHSVLVLKKNFITLSLWLALITFLYSTVIGAVVVPFLQPFLMIHILYLHSKSSNKEYKTSSED